MGTWRALYPRKILHAPGAINIHGGVSPAQPRIRALQIQSSVRCRHGHRPPLFYFLLPISRESIVFGTNFQNGDFDGFTRFEVS